MGMGRGRGRGKGLRRYSNSFNRAYPERLTGKRVPSLRIASSQKFDRGYLASALAEPASA